MVDALVLANNVAVSTLIIVVSIRPREQRPGGQPLWRAPLHMCMLQVITAPELFYR